MDSKAVNKLIRAEVWPVLRRQGFTKFDSRTAWRYRGPLVDVVNFQSFNSFMADGLGCTTYSFALNLGVYLTGSQAERSVKVDASGFVRPTEYHCPFRARLSKRGPIDGFAPLGIFSVSPDGGTLGPVFREVLYLLENEALRWFEAFRDLGEVLDAVNRVAPLPGAERLGLGVMAAPGSAVVADLIASIQVARHRVDPTSVPAVACLDAIDDAVGTMLDVFLAGFTRPEQIEWESRRFRSLMSGIQGPVELPPETPRVNPVDCELMGQRWDWPASPLQAGEPVRSAREALWPLLRKAGFDRFTDRVAHRTQGRSIEVVEFVPMPAAERRAGKYPEGLFRLGLGVHWPQLAKEAVGRPKLEDCLVQTWLMPAEAGPGAALTCFDGADSARQALETAGLAWFQMWREEGRGPKLLTLPDWVMVAAHPTMRGQGSRRSVSRGASPCSVQPTFRERASSRGASGMGIHKPAHDEGERSEVDREGGEPVGNDWCG